MFASITFVNDDGGEYGGLEYPPSPSRFLQAIIAGTQGSEKYMPLLRYLETVVPRIYATREFAAYSYETYVPKNSWNSELGQSYQQRNASSRKRVNVRLFSGGGPHVVYDYNVPSELTPIFKEAVGQVGVLGRAMDIVITQVADTLPARSFDLFVPEATNARGSQVRLNAPVPGFIDSVFRRYHQKSTRLTVGNKLFTKNPQRELPYALFELTQPVPIEYTSHVAAWIRHAAMTNARAEVADAISGHGKERLMIVPIPTLYWRDRRLHRVIITGENTKLVAAADSALSGLNLRSNEGADMGYLMPAEHDPVFAQFLRPSRRWVSATPVLVSGHDDHDARKHRRLLEKMFWHAGLPRPVSVARIPGDVRGFFVGSKHGHERLHRMFCAVEFDQEVSGVVAVGTGRYVGLGVFANVNGSSAAG